jgi:hypothetical protein
MAVAMVLVATACGEGRSQTQGGVVEQKSGLSAVRLIGSRPALQKIAEAAARVRWTQSTYDAKGRLVLTAPPNYTSDDFGRLLQAIGPYTSDIQGLQMLGPNGGSVDDKGVEHPDG